MKFRGGEFSTGTTGNFHPELTIWSKEYSESNIVYGEASFSRPRRLQARETSLWEVP